MGKAKKSPAASSASKKTTKKSPAPASATKKVVGRPKKATTTSSTSTTNDAPTITSTGIVVAWKIPGVTLDKVREKVQKMIETGDKETLTVKSVRTHLEEWLDMDLTEHKDTVRSLTMEFL